jgi:CheY-like chemotaxis protein
VALVLIVDDEFGVAAVLEAVLEDAGHQVIIAMNGRVGLDKLAAPLPAGAAASRTLPDLILLDYMMPELNGAGFLRALRARDEYRHIPVLMMSSVDEATLREQCAGCAAYLRKPFELDELMAVVAGLLERAG